MTLTLNSYKRWNADRADPTRTGALRRAFLAELRRRFKRVQSIILDHVGREDAFGLTANVRMCWGKPCPEGATDPDPEPEPAKPGLLHRIKSKVQQKYAKLEARYGPKYAKAIIGATLASIPIPGGSLAPLLLTGIAEVHRKLSPAPVGNKSEIDWTETELTEADVRRLAQQFLDELHEEHKDEQLTENAAPRFALTENAPRFDFMSAPEAAKAFHAWVKKLLQREIIGLTEDELWRKFVKEAYEKGAGRSWEDVKRSQIRPGEASLMDQESGWGKLSDFYQGSKDEFLRSSFMRPVSIERVKVLAARTFTDLSGVTDQLATKMSRSLLDGFIQGQHPKVIAKSMSDELGIGLSRAQTIARTEVSRAYVEGQLNTFEDLGVQQLGVMVEWQTRAAGYPEQYEEMRVCELCQDLEGIVLSLDEAHGMFPRHPNCGCALVPANVGEDREDQVRSKLGIDRAIRKSVEREGGLDETTWAGADKTISRKRPKSVLTGNEDVEYWFHRNESEQAVINVKTWRPGHVYNCGGKGGTPGPCKSVEDTLAAVKHHYENHREVSYDDIRQLGDDVGKLRSHEVKQVAEKFGVLDHKSKKDAVEKIVRRITDRKQSAQRIADIGEDSPSKEQYAKASGGFESLRGHDGLIGPKLPSAAEQVEEGKHRGWTSNEINEWLVDNCGGKGGKPGPCPTAVQKYVGKTVGHVEHEHSAKVEAVVARHLGGKQLDDNEPLDVRIPAKGGGEHAVEVKSLLKGKKQSISVHPDALARKLAYSEANPGSTFHTVVVDDRATFGGGEHSAHYSGNRFYYKRGNDRYSLSKMHPVKNAAELKALIHASDDSLPEAARGSLPQGAEAERIKAMAKDAHAARLKKDRARKARLKAQGKSAYERQT